MCVKISRNEAIGKNRLIIVMSVNLNDYYFKKVETKSLIQLHHEMVPTNFAVKNEDTHGLLGEYLQKSHCRRHSPRKMQVNWI